MPNSASATCHFCRAAEGGLGIGTLQRRLLVYAHPLLLLRAQLTTFDSSTMPRVGSAARTVSAT